MVSLQLPLVLHLQVSESALMAVCVLYQALKLLFNDLVLLLGLNELLFVVILQRLLVGLSQMVCLFS